ncbi:MAG: hypothetical protein ACP5VE_03245 [Chthonomonadales bacterium]
MARALATGAALALAIVVLCVAGCSKQPEANSSAASPSQTENTPAPPLTPDVARLTPNSPSNSPTFNPHMSGGMPAGMPNPHASEKGGKENPQVVAAVGRAQKAEADLKANPADAALRQKAAQADYDAGNQMMTQSTQPPKVKYPAALRYFRRAVELDPGNKEAAAGRDLIEGIYKSMNLPIPK